MGDGDSGSSPFTGVDRTVPYFRRDTSENLWSDSVSHSRRVSGFPTTLAHLLLPCPGSRTPNDPRTLTVHTVHPPSRSQSCVSQDLRSKVGSFPWTWDITGEVWFESYVVRGQDRSRCVLTQGLRGKMRLPRDWKWTLDTVPHSPPSGNFGFLPSRRNSVSTPPSPLRPPPSPLPPHPSSSSTRGSLGSRGRKGHGFCGPVEGPVAAGNGTCHWATGDTFRWTGGGSGGGGGTGGLL